MIRISLRTPSPRFCSSTFSLCRVFYYAQSFAYFLLFDLELELISKIVFPLMQKRTIAQSPKKFTTGIIGVGMVGGALAHVLEKPLLFDSGKNLGSMAEVSKADILFICVPTPYDEKKKGFDVSIVEEVFSKIKGEKIVVIKSTVTPGTTEYFQKKYPQHRFLFNPEFLTEVTADQDMRYPDRQIIGHTKESYNAAGELMQMLPIAPFERIMPATEAEMVKYFGNTWFSTKVVFANQMYDLCQALGVDYDTVKDSA